MNILEIFEVRDETDEELYFTLGLFLTLEEGIKAIKEKPYHGSPYTDYDEEALYRIYRRIVGKLSEDEKLMYEIHFEGNYDEKEDGTIWKVVKEKQF